MNEYDATTKTLELNSDENDLLVQLVEQYYYTAPTKADELLADGLLDKLTEEYTL
jgi:hypothetical protein